MKRKGSKVGLIGMALFWAGWMAFSSVSHATLPIQKKAKELGYPAANCQYCHVEKLPKKGAMTHNERGKWLLDQKAKHGAKEVDPAWLKDYPGGK
ncbi:MAG TPA: hypothetical protein VLE54_01630 [Thermoanaerobaculia bacterium]|nr:hypothetical protein [Thermoanaerobaculia bacterium]